MIVCKCGRRRYNRSIHFFLQFYQKINFQMKGVFYTVRGRRLFIQFRQNLPQGQQKILQRRCKESWFVIWQENQEFPKRRSNVEGSKPIGWKVAFLVIFQKIIKLRTLVFFVVCSNRNANEQRKHEIWFLFCKNCQNHPGMHPVLCFEKFHTLKDFK